MEKSSHSIGVRRIALIGNYLPRRCGLATFTADVHDATRVAFPDLAIDVCAMDDRAEGYDYPAAVVHRIAQDDPAAYAEAARRIEASGAQAILVQHEFGIYGGAAGEHLLRLLDRTGLPLVVTLHTVLERPDADQRRVTEALLRRADRVHVMAERGREILTRVYGADARRIVVIPHGAPDRAYVEPDALKPRFGWEGRRVALTFGLLSPGKGIETVIEALPRVVERHPELLYVVLGSTHPNLVAREGEAYRERLQALAARLGVERNVELVDGFVEQEELLDRLQAADLYATPYLGAAQITSGTLSYAVAMGKPVVSTPYVHATELLADGHGVLAPFGGADGFADAFNRLLSEPAERRAIAARAYARGRETVWPRFAAACMEAIEAAVAARPSRLARPAGQRPLAPDFAAVERMSDATGMLQHAVYSVPDRRHGYCVDDNARALILACRMPGLDEASRDRWTTTYASFVQHAWNADARRFRNFMSFDRRWLEEAGSEDSNGRAIWALGVAARDAHLPKHRDWAISMFDATASLSLELGSPRAQAFAMLGAAAMLEARPGHGIATEILRRFPDEHLEMLAEARRPEWRWFEIVLAYDNARLPEALIRAGMALGRDDLVACGTETLDWIIGKQTGPEGRFRAVGTESFGRAYAEPLPFDQQPLEAQATIDACEAAHAATGDARWVDEAERAYRWFLGGNDLDLPLATAADGGCFDGLMPTGLNRNQGAESILALQLASCAISRLPKPAAAVADRERAAA